MTLCSFLYRLLQELPIFLSMVKDVFCGDETICSAVGLNEPFMQEVLSAYLPLNPTASAKLLSPNRLACMSELLKQQATESHLIPSPRWIAKVEQLFVQSQLKHGK